MAVSFDEAELRAVGLEPDPFASFESWFQGASAVVPMPEAMAVATATADGRPSVRMMLLRGFDPRGFVFFTNYQSRKGGELDANPFAALLFHWQPLERQIRIEGPVERVSAPESDAYFSSRPYGNRLAAIASPQSRPIESRDALLLRMAELRRAHPEGGAVPRPAHWGGFRVLPERFEFWLGRPDRLHDRYSYTKDQAGDWSIARLGP